MPRLAVFQDNFLDSYLTQQFQLQNPDQAMPHQPSAEVLTAALGAPPVIPNGPETAASHGLGIVQSPGTMVRGKVDQPPSFSVWSQSQSPSFSLSVLTVLHLRGKAALQSLLLL